MTNYNRKLLSALYQHNLWANRRLYAAALALSDEQLDAKASGTFGSIRETLVHIVRSEEWYCSILQSGEFPDDPPTVETPLARLSQLVEYSGQALLEAALKSDPAQKMPTGRDEDLVPAQTVLIQALHHASEHRTQIETLMGQMGVETPGLSGWAFGDDIGMGVEK